MTDKQERDAGEVQAEEFFKSLETKGMVLQTVPVIIERRVGYDAPIYFLSQHTATANREDGVTAKVFATADGSLEIVLQPKGGEYQERVQYVLNLHSLLEHTYADYDALMVEKGDKNNG